MDKHRATQRIAFSAALVTVGALTTASYAHAQTLWSRIHASACSLDTGAAHTSATLVSQGWECSNATILCPILDLNSFPQESVTEAFADVDLQVSGGSVCARSVMRIIPTPGPSIVARAPAPRLPVILG
jgi:hypothetical protein